MVKNSASPNRPFFFFGNFVPFTPFLTGTTHYHCRFQIISGPNQCKNRYIFFFFTHTYLFHFFSLRPYPPLIEKGGGIFHIHIHFPMGLRPSVALKGEGICLSSLPLLNVLLCFVFISVCLDNCLFNCSTEMAVLT